MNLHVGTSQSDSIVANGQFGFRCLRSLGICLATSRLYRPTSQYITLPFPSSTYFGSFPPLDTHHLPQNPQTYPIPSYSTHPTTTSNDDVCSEAIRKGELAPSAQPIHSKLSLTSRSLGAHKSKNHASKAKLPSSKHSWHHYGPVPSMQLQNPL